MTHLIDESEVEDARRETMERRHVMRMRQSTCSGLDPAGCGNPECGRCHGSVDDECTNCGQVRNECICEEFSV